MESNYNSTFASAARHVPRALRQQLICKLTSQFLESYGIEDDVTFPKDVYKMEPSMERFYGALLFVDISGFTALAQKLDVESLKNHINDYFTKMLNVIDKWEGDVIKFAGDALYIVWRVEYTNKAANGSAATTATVESNKDSTVEPSSTARDVFSDNRFIASAKGSVERAVSCALEINACCCNHKVILEDNAMSAAQSRWSKLFNSLPVVLGQANNVKVAPMAKGDDKTAYLNVHSGVGFGLLAGVDVGSRDRWEFFLLGEPIGQVANAESLAQTGDVVISDIAHSLIHQFDAAPVETPAAGGGGDASAKQSPVLADEAEEPTLSCGCCRLQYDFFRISKNMPSPSNNRKAKFRRSKSKAKFDEFALNEALQTHEEKLYEYYAEEIEGAFACIQMRLKRLMQMYLDVKKINCRSLITSHTAAPCSSSSSALLPSTTAAEDDVASTTIASLTVPQRSKLDRFIVDFVHSHVRDQFFLWISKCLIDDLVKHAHEAARGSKLEFFNMPRMFGFQRLMMKHFEALLDTASGKVPPPLASSRSGTGAALDMKPVAEEDELDEELDSTVTVKPFGAGHGHSGGGSSGSHGAHFGAATGGGAGHHGRAARRSSLVGLRKTSSQKNMIQDASLSAEMRTVTVLFVKIDGLASTVTIDDGRDDFAAASNDVADDEEAFHASVKANGFISDEALFGSPPATASRDRGGGRSSGGGGGAGGGGSRMRRNAQVCYDQFHFLQRSEREEAADEALLARLQACMDVLVTAFSMNGGHLRQFIIDDKGTVCIGTFGLRGSVAGDNAAAALETAKKIIIDLQAIDLTAAIGITSGKAYCGIVGSPTRHEYAVMGPSVNLSARLMCQAMACTVICDSETKARDRAHSFEPLKEVVAKGYVQPVMTYKPVFVDLLSSSAAIAGGGHAKISEQALTALSPDVKWRAHAAAAGGLLRSSLDAVALESFHQFAHVLHRDSFDLDGGSGSRKSLLFSPASTQSLQPPGGSSMSLLAAAMTNAAAIANGAASGSALNVFDRSPTQPPGGAVVGGSGAFAAMLASDFYVQRRKGSRDFAAVAAGAAASASSASLRATSASASSATAAAAAGLQQARLYGREKEIAAIVDFLLQPVAVSSATLLQAYHHVPLAQRQRRPLFDLTSPCRLLAVTGNEGLGKSALVNAVAKKLVTMTRTDATWNVAVCKNKPSSLHTNVPFYPFVFIVQDLFVKVHRAFVRTTADGAPAAVGGGAATMRRQAVAAAAMSIEAQIASGMAYLLKQLPPETQELAPLLRMLNIAPPPADGSGETDNARTQPLRGRSRYLHALELLFQLLQAYPPLSNRLVFVVLYVCVAVCVAVFVCRDTLLRHAVCLDVSHLCLVSCLCLCVSRREKLCLFDPWSLSLLHRLWKHGKGFVFLVTYCPLELQPAAAASALAGGHATVSIDLTAAMSGPGGSRRYGSVSLGVGGGSVLIHPSSKLGAQLAAALATATGSAGGAYITRTGSADADTSPSRHASQRSGSVFLKAALLPTKTSLDERFFAKYWDDARFSRLELKLLDADAIVHLVRDTLAPVAATQGAQVVSRALLDKVVELSGGNALYAVEIANAINASAPGALAAFNAAVAEQEAQQWQQASKLLSSSGAAGGAPLGGGGDTPHSRGASGSATPTAAAAASAVANGDGSRRVTTAAAPLPPGTPSSVHRDTSNSLVPHGGGGGVAGGGGGDTKVTASLEQILAATSNRIEEVICYRFDQLPHATQVMLKAAAVISANGALFSLACLVGTLQESSRGGIGGEDDALDERVVMQALAELVQREEFLVMVDAPAAAATSVDGIGDDEGDDGVAGVAGVARHLSLGEHDDDDVDADEARDVVTRPRGLSGVDGIVVGASAATSTSASSSPTHRNSRLTGGATRLDPATLRRARFGFRVVLEQLTLYNLLVREKKEKIHDAVATFFRRQAQLHEASVEALLEEAFHWQHAMVWAHALSCVYKAATQLWELGDYQGYQVQLHAALRVYDNLRSDVGVAPPGELSLDRLVALFQRDAAHAQQAPHGGKAASHRFLLTHSNSGHSPGHFHHSGSGLHGAAAGSGPDDANGATHNANGNAHSTPRPTATTLGSDALSTEVIHEMCYSDNETLSTILHTHVAMAQFNVLTLESPLYTTLLLEEGLQLLLLSGAEAASPHGTPTASGRHAHATATPPSTAAAPLTHAASGSRPGSAANSPRLAPTALWPHHTPRSPRSALAQRAAAAALAAGHSGPPSPSGSAHNLSALSLHHQHATAAGGSASPSAASSPTAASAAMHRDAVATGATMSLSTMAAHAASSSGNMMTLLLKKSAQQHFRLPDYAPLHLSLYAAAIHVHTWAPTSTAPRLRKAEWLQRQFVQLVKHDPAVQARQPALHFLQALVQSTALHLRHTRLKEAWLCAKSLAKRYDVERHHRGLLSLYGLDAVTHTLASVAQQLFLVGDIAHGTALLDVALRHWRVLTHPYTLQYSFLPLAACLRFFHRHEDAIRMLDYLAAMDAASVSLACLPAALTTDVKSVLVLQMKLVEGLFAAPATPTTTAAVVAAPTKPMRRPLRASIFVASGGGGGSGDASATGGGAAPSLRTAAETRRSISAENRILPPTLAADEEYAPRRQSYLGHVLFVAGLAAEAVKVEVDLLAQLQHPTRLLDAPQEVLDSFADKYSRLAAAAPVAFDHCVLSELWPLMTLLVLFRRDTPLPIAARGHVLPRRLVKAVVALAKRCEAHQFYLATALLGEFLAEMPVASASVTRLGDKLRLRSFDAIRAVQRPDKLAAFEETFRLIVKGEALGGDTPRVATAAAAAAAVAAVEA